MPNWIQVARTDDCPSGSTLEAVAGDQIVALSNIDGKFYALDGVCSHGGGPLGKGILTGKIVTCPWHGRQFDVTSGQECLSQTRRQQSFAVKIENGHLLVDIGEQEGA